MDRRAALCRLAAGGAVLGVASAVTSTTAFADGGSIPCRPTAPTATPVFSLSSGGAFVRIQVSGLGTTTCPGCAGGSTVPVVQNLWSLDSTSEPLIVRNGSGTTITNVWQSPADNDVRVRRVDLGALTNPTTFTVRVTYRWVCRGATGAAWACQSWVQTIQYTGSATALTAVTLSGIGNCDATPPANP
jgi:hypothetical protein